MVTWIGLCAGEIWRYLDARDGECSLKNIIKDINAPHETILMAVGWLAREGHVLLRGTMPNITIKLHSSRS